MANRITRAVSSRFRRIAYKIGSNKFQGVSLLRRLSNFEINGTGNTIIINGKLPTSVRIVIYGNNHRLFIDKEVTFKKGVIWFEDNGNEIHIGEGTSIEEANLAVAESGTKLLIGKDCMFSRSVHIATTDSHSIIDVMTGKRTNPAKDIIIGNHVWLGYCVNVGKGVSIGDNAVVASHSVVTKSVEPGTIVAGVPARVVKEGITWTRARL